MKTGTGTKKIAARKRPDLLKAAPAMDPEIAIKANPLTGPIKLVRSRDGLARYGRAVQVDIANVKVEWNGTSHLFSRRTGQVIESEHGVMEGFCVSAADFQRVGFKPLKAAKQYGELLEEPVSLEGYEG